ncbi:MAG: hypothetical protein R3B45_11245 [Bdellovibrionota bacterium]
MNTSENKIDDCPEWAEEEIVKLQLMEIALGNIPSTAEWQSQHLAEVQKKVFSDISAPNTNEDIDRHFNKIARKLSIDGFDASKITNFINNRVGYKGGPKYCTVDEVLEAVKV